MALGYAHPDHLLRELTSWQISEWLAYYQIEPFGEERADLRAGIVASVTANANRDADKRPEPYSPADFMPRFDREDEEPEGQSVEEQIAIMQMFTMAFGGDMT